MISSNDFNNLPKDPDALQDIIRNIYSDYAELKEKAERLDQENAWLRELIAARNRRLFGRKSEKLNYEELQAWLFNEAEIGITEKKTENEEEDIIVKTIIRKKSKRGRKPVSDKLPRKDINHDVPEAEKICSCCGKERPKLKPEISEEVEYIPAKVFVNRHIYHKYGPCKCAESRKKEIKPIIRAERKKRIIPGSIAAPSLLSFIATSKFCDALPYYRIEEILTRSGIRYSRATICNQMIGVSRNLQPLLDLMWEDLLAGDVIRMDETRLQVIDEPGRKADQISWMHVASGEHEGKKIIIFHYHTSRKGDIPKTILEGWQGYLQTDGLAAYNKAGNQQGIIRVGCWSHARRKYIDARGGPKAPDGGLADEALSFIRILFETETDLRSKDLSDEEFVRRRKEIVEPVLNEYRKWLDKHISQVLPSSFLAKAMYYADNHWKELVNYLEHPKLCPDNNIVERIIKQFVIGRKNWLFAYSPLGAHASAALYTFIQSARANGLDEYAYMKYVLTVLPYTQPERLHELLPHRIDVKLLEKV